MEGISPTLDGGVAWGESWVPLPDLDGEGVAVAIGPAVNAKEFSRISTAIAVGVVGDVGYVNGAVGRDAHEGHADAALADGAGDTIGLHVPKEISIGGVDRKELIIGGGGALALDDVNVVGKGIVADGALIRGACGA